MLIETIPSDNDVDFPKVNVYFEDSEAKDFFKRLIKNRKITKHLELMDVSMGCKDYTKLAKHNIPEFSKRSIIVLDADVDEKNIKNVNSVILLPTKQPPDRLIFKFLYYLEPDDPFWTNSRQFTKEVFSTLTNVSDIITRLKLENTNIDEFDNLVQKDLDSQDTNKIRNMFKNFYKDKNLQSLLTPVKNNPFEVFLKRNPQLRDNFQKDFISIYKEILEKGHGVPKSKIESYFN